MKPKNLDAALDACQTLSTTPPRAGLAFGALVGTSPQTPIVSISAQGQAAYENYYSQCKQRQKAGAGRRSVAEGESATEKQKAADEAFKKAQKAKEEADTKQKQADEAAKKLKDAQKAEEEADKKAQDTNNDPNATPAQKAQAGNDAVKAGNDRRLAEVNAADVQKAADDAKGAASQAERDAIDAQKEADLSKAIDDAVAAWALRAIGGAVVGASPHAEALYQTAAATEFLSRVAGAYAGRYGYDCMEGECGYSSCEGEARARAYEEEAQSYRSKPVCNVDVTPLPDQDRCYDKIGGLLDVPQVTLVQQLTWVCKNLQKVSDKDCKKIMPPGVFKVISTDPCNSPYGMCAPETSRRLFGGSNPSAPIPSLHRGDDPTMWVTPPSGQSTPPDR